MFNLTNIFYKILSLLVTVLVKSKILPEKPILKLGLDTSQPIVYVVPYKSKIVLLTLRAQSLSNNLPDPLEPLIIAGLKMPRSIIIDNKSYIFTTKKKKTSTTILQDYLALHNTNKNLNVQIVPVTVKFGRYPNNKKSDVNKLFHVINSIKKIFTIIWFGRDSFVCFSYSISLRKIAMKYGVDKITVKKLERMIRIYFIRQNLVSTGPYLSAHYNLLDKLLSSKMIIKAIEDEVRSKKIPNEKAKQKTIFIIKEISAKFSHKMIHLANKILNLTCNYLYQNINVYNVERVCQIAYNGHEIIYIPCHRSHMDYLLLSYVLYNHGLIPPHIAAGINLNFWPAGMILRRLGAFFIHRNFKSNKLYSAIFREYLGELFNCGYSVEYFIEGGRSRTGFLLDPKTGILSITIQAMLRGYTRPITLIPVYIGYEHIIEVDTYIQELHGASKEKESLFKMLYGLSKLCNLGQGYVNFGEPLSLITWLNNCIPEWRKSINLTEFIRPTWLTTAINSIAINLMVRINNASTVNAINLCCTALLSAYKYSLTREQLAEQLKCYLELMYNVPYSKYTSIPSITTNELINRALQMNQFIAERGDSNDIFILSHKQAIIMTYYRNNIAHMLVLPSLIAAIVIQCHCVSRKKIFFYIKILYPMLKAELFLHWEDRELVIELNKLINELLRQNLILSDNNKILINPSRFSILQLLAAGIRETLQRYAITFWLLITNPSINCNMLKEKSSMLARHLLVLHKINAPEYFDKATFNKLVLILRNKGYISIDSGNVKFKQTMRIYRILSILIAPEIRFTIEGEGSK